ncbi:MAG TPA: hydroxymethylbilane synthase [Anaerolineales bacterium]
MTTLTFATRPSALARWQTQWVIRSLQQVWPDLECQEKVITTQGDRILHRPLPEIGGKGLFTQELEAELLTGQVQAAVHSLKDLPVENPPGLTIGAVPLRADVRDVLVSKRGYTLDSLPEGAVVGTSSLRRGAQLLAHRADLQIQPLRGNVDTRIRKALNGEYDAIVLAAAGVTRLGLESHVSQWLPLENMLPAPGQGALAVQCNSKDEVTLEILAAIEDPDTRKATLAERAFLTHLGGGCSLPVGAYAEAAEEDIELQGVVASLDGKNVIHCRGWGREAEKLGRDCAQQALDRGAGEVLRAEGLDF